MDLLFVLPFTRLPPFFFGTIPCPPTPQDIEIGVSKRANILIQIWLLLVRSFRTYMREPLLLRARLAQVCAVGCAGGHGAKGEGGPLNVEVTGETLCWAHSCVLIRYRVIFFYFRDTHLAANGRHCCI